MPDQEIRAALAVAVGGVVAALVAMADPAAVVLGGTWGTHPVLLEAVSEELARLSRQVAVGEAQVRAEPSLTGARHQALAQLRAAILAVSSSGPGASSP